MRDLWLDIQPGDIGFDRGVGLSGWVIRVGTQSPYGHCFVYHRYLGSGAWETIEAGPRGGVLVRTRTVRPNKVVRVWNTKKEQKRLLEASRALVGASYGWGEIVRIGARILGLRVPKWKDNPRRVICSNHCLTSILACRPQLASFFRYEPREIWPGELAINLDAIEWAQARVKERKRGTLA